MIYKLQKDGYGQDYVVQDTGAGFKVIPFDLDNTDYQAYLKWLEKGNTPLSASNSADDKDGLPLVEVQ